MIKRQVIVVKTYCFKLYKAKRNKKGVVCDQKAINEALADFNRLCADFGFKILAQENSAIKGKNGNQEIFFHLKV